MQSISLHGYSGEISGGGCQHISILRLFTGAEIKEVRTWSSTPQALAQTADTDLSIHGSFLLDNGLSCAVFGSENTFSGVQVCCKDLSARWSWGPPQLFGEIDEEEQRQAIEPHYAPYEWHEFGYLTGALRSLIAALEGQSPLWISGHDLRQALEVAIAAKCSAQRDGTPVNLPLADRSLTLYPSPYRWLGGDATGKVQPLEEVGKET